MFGAIILTKNINDIDEYKYSRYGIGFDREGKSSVGNGFGRNCIIFGVDMSSSVRADNKKQDILILGESLIQGLDGIILTAEKMSSINFTENNKKFCLTLHYNGVNSYLFVYGIENNKFKKTFSEIVAVSLCLENISKEFSTDNINVLIMMLL